MYFLFSRLGNQFRWRWLHRSPFSLRLEGLLVSFRFPRVVPLLTLLGHPLYCFKKYLCAVVPITAVRWLFLLPRFGCYGIPYSHFRGRDRSFKRFDCWWLSVGMCSWFLILWFLIYLIALGIAIVSSWKTRQYFWSLNDIISLWKDTTSRPVIILHGSKRIELKSFKLMLSL